MRRAQVYHAAQCGMKLPTGVNMITVKYFASLREELGKAEDAFDAAGMHSVEDVWRAAAPGRALGDVLCAVNREYAKAETRVGDGDEVAFFPPVTGG